MRYFLLLFISFAISAKDQNPNIIMIVGDDIGYSDIACFGAEINTPNLDKLAEQGIRFTNFNNMAKCNPTRSSIMTGLYTEKKGAYCFAQSLREAGYFTMFAGKHHLDPWVPERVFAKNSFDRWFESPFSAFMIHKNGDFPQYNRNDQRAIFDFNGTKLDVTELETSKPFHKTDATTDYALRFLNEAHCNEEPFFLYLAYHAAHFPLHAPEDDVKKYRELYKRGWDVVRAERIAKMKKLGLIADSAKIPAFSKNVNQTRQPSIEENLERRQKSMYHRPWDSLSKKEQVDYAEEMAVFAAMVDRMDRNIGRILKQIKDMGEEENTLIMFFSDNGSCPYDFNRNFDIPPGPAEGYRSLSAPWASVGNTPFRYFKQFGHRGGMTTHFVARWPKVIAPGSWSDSATHVVDLAPTMMELTQAKEPEKLANVAARHDGISFLNELRGKQVSQRPYLFGGFEGFYSYQEGDWKIVQLNDGTEWELYHLKDDPFELNDLSRKKPELCAQLIQKMKSRKELPKVK